MSVWRPFARSRCIFFVRAAPRKSTKFASRARNFCRRARPFCAIFIAERGETSRALRNHFFHVLRRSHAMRAVGLRVFCARCGPKMREICKMRTQFLAQSSPILRDLCRRTRADVARVSKSFSARSAPVRALALHVFCARCAPKMRKFCKFCTQVLARSSRISPSLRLRTQRDAWRVAK